MACLDERGGAGSGGANRAGGRAEPTMP